MTGENIYGQRVDIDFMGRIDLLETMLRDLSCQMDRLERQIEQVEPVFPVNLPLDTIEAHFLKLEAFIIKQFPQYARITDTSLDIPGVTGDGEIGPGNQPMPSVHAGGNAIRDPYSRCIR